MRQIGPHTQEAVRCFLALIANRYDVAGAICMAGEHKRYIRPNRDTNFAAIRAE